MNNEEALTVFLSAHIRVKAFSKIARGDGGSRISKQILNYYIYIEAQKLKITPDLLLLKGRHNPIEITRARWRIWTKLQKNYNYSSLAIARAFGCDHTTILHGIKFLRAKP